MPSAVTVIIAAYNAESTIKRAIESALNQTIEPEVIIVNDGSTDSTVAVALETIGANPRAKILVQKSNLGPSAARNRALDTATGNWITILDADDVMSETRLGTMRNIAEKRGWDAIGDDQYRVSNRDGSSAARRLWSDTDFGEIELSLACFVRENIADYAGSNGELGYIKPLIRRDFLIENELRYDTEMRLGEDYDLYARMLLKGGKFGLVDPLGYFAFDTPGSLSRAHGSNELEKLAQSDRNLLSSDRLSKEDRAILHEHLRMTQKKVAWAKLGEAYHERSVSKALSSFAMPPDVLADLFSKLFELGRRKSGLMRRS